MAKAKFVYESLNFERKPLSRETLGIGAIEIVRKFFQEEEEVIPFEEFKKLPIPFLSVLKVMDMNPEIWGQREIWSFYKYSKEKISEEERELIDSIFSKLYKKRSRDKSLNYTAQLDTLVGYNSPEEFFQKMPLTAEAIKEYPAPFVYQGAMSFGNLAPYFYKNYFNPLNYHIEDVKKIAYLAFIKILEDFPEFYKYFRKNASSEQKITWGSFGASLKIYDKFPELLEDVLNSNDPVTDRMADFLIYNFTGIAGEIELLRRYVNSSNNDEIKRKIKRKLKRKKWENAFNQIYGEIKESVNFKRGLEPKKSIGIGRETLMKKIDWALNYFPAALDDRPESLNNIRVYDFILDYKGFPIIIYDFGYGFYRASSTIDISEISTTPEAALDGIKRRIDDRVKIKESQNFERGLTPKESMNIGSEALKKKLDNETDWGFEFLKSFQIKTWDIIEYEGFLIKIVQLKGSDGISYYAALNNTGEPYNNTPAVYDTPEEALDWEQKYIDQYNMDL